MNDSKLINRRTLLRGIGGAMALPWLEAMGPLTSCATASEPGKPGHESPESSGDFICAQRREYGRLDAQTRG